MGKGKIFANLTDGGHYDARFTKFFLANAYMTEDLPVDSPKCFAPFISSVMIRQNFPCMILDRYHVLQSIHV